VSANAPAIRDAMINIDVPDLEAALRFYTQGLGLTLARRLFDNTVAEMEGAPCLLYLLEKKAQSGALPQQDAKRDYGRHWTPVHLDFVVDRLESSIERLIAAGARLESGPTDFAWGRQATFSDPFGHGICLIQWLGRGYGEVTSELGEESPPAQAAGRTGIQTMYQAWKTQDGAAFFPASRLGEMRANPAMTLEALLFEIEANTYEEAAAIYNLRMGFGPYQPGGDPAPCPNCGAWFYPQGSGECWRCGKIA
jgi:predicted enzyme related to lactoylglutathione lyase